MSLAVDVVSLFYQGEYIPLFVYEDGALTAQFPESELSVAPPALYREALQAKAAPIALTYADTGCTYFRVCAEEGVEVYGGPVPQTWLDADAVSALCRDYLIGGESAEAFADYLGRIPPYNTVILGKKLNLLLYCLGGPLCDTVGDELLIGNDRASGADRRAADATELLYASHTEESYNNSYEIEALLQKFVTEGDLDGYNAFVKDLPPMNTGKLAPSGLRNTKNNFIVTTALTCRTAIAAGLPRETAYALSDSYIREVEALSSVETVLRLSDELMRDFITRIQRSKAAAAPAGAHTKLLHSVVNYIHRNLNHRLSIDDVAAYAGLSRSYLSTLFRQSMGVPLNRYISDAKLDEAARLLRYTDRSIADIAEYLCFSSQSHFQQVFKDKYGTTPRTYRNGASAEPTA